MLDDGPGLRFYPYRPGEELECPFCGRRFPFFNRINRGPFTRHLRRWIPNRPNAERHLRACERKAAKEKGGGDGE